jgi:hypothetical protein
MKKCTWPHLREDVGANVGKHETHLLEVSINSVKSQAFRMRCVFFNLMSPILRYIDGSNFS